MKDNTTSREALIVLHCLAIGSERELKRLSLIIKKDLDVLDILKKHIYSSDSSISIILDDLRCYDDFQKIKEWLENDSNKNKSVDSES